MFLSTLFGIASTSLGDERSGVEVLLLLTIIMYVILNVYEPRQDKTCLREFPTRPDTNRSAQPQKLARVMEFRLYNLEVLYYLSSE